MTSVVDALHKCQVLLDFVFGVIFQHVKKEILCKILSALRLIGMRGWDRSNVYLAFASQPWSALLPNFCSFTQLLHGNNYKRKLTNSPFGPQSSQRKLGELL